MLPQNFAATAGDELRPVLQQIGRWCDDHEDLALDPRRIAHELDIETESLIEALDWLVSRGLLRQVYRFENNGIFIGDDYESFLDVPERLRDRFDKPVRRWDGTIVPVFREVK